MSADYFLKNVAFSQDYAHCGPASLSACLALLGFDAGQHRLARDAGKPGRIYWEGVDALDLRRAARRNGARAEFLERRRRSWGDSFARALRVHLRRGAPAILSVDDHGHWVAVLAWREDSRRFVIMDPNDDDRAFAHWSEEALLANAWNEPEPDDDDDEPEPPSYFAVLVSRRDGKPPRWLPTREFLDRCANGAAETADAAAQDLLAAVRRATPSPASRRRVPLAGVLDSHRELVLDSLDHWTRYPASRADVEHLYDTWCCVAESGRLTAPSNVYPAALVAQLVAILTTFAWTEEL